MDPNESYRQHCEQRHLREEWMQSCRKLLKSTNGDGPKAVQRFPLRDPILGKQLHELESLGWEAWGEDDLTLAVRLPGDVALCFRAMFDRGTVGAGALAELIGQQ